ncbi:sugar phosphate isomerase/epimerase [Chitinophagaceae bacterium LB-8]|uniref:Sugar phosphate isomerase/epimerase n=1 Tax=Paraflavisolibacter caeni TaxID=2982496 RepID=A0A9X3BHJ7_9BACT|nr:TIM barrel protein [Paraflavisolibacter caeni]MCU7549772.1 sugar phosphate isomerase/epimerase [Paraflavisolibacter caeni]
MQHDIDFGVSLYGFTQQWCENKDYGFDDMFKELNRLGIKKFEIVGSQMFNNYPNPTEEEINHLLALCKKYDVEPFSYGGGIDAGKYSDHDMTDQEIIAEVTFELMTAYKLGCKYIRGFGIPTHLVKEVARFAEFYNIKIAIEVHAPSRPSDPKVQELIQQIKESGSSFIGLVPDFGCFVERPNPFVLQRYIGLGANEAILNFIVENRHNGYTEESIWQKVQEMGGGQTEKLAISELFGYLSFAPADLEGFKSLLPWCLYFHGKFYHIDENGVETTIPYQQLLKLIVESGFKGVIMTEYEGHCFYLNDAPEQIKRHLQMERNILSQLEVKRISTV